MNYCPKGVPVELIDTHFEDKEFVDAIMIKEITEDKKLFKIFYEISGLCNRDNGELNHT